jgi:hypothetical protein
MWAFDIGGSFLEVGVGEVEQGDPEALGDGAAGAPVELELVDALVGRLGALEVVAFDRARCSLTPSR